jgi:hypothetical protein
MGSGYGSGVGRKSLIFFGNRILTLIPWGGKYGFFASFIILGRNAYVKKIE